MEEGESHSDDPTSNSANNKNWSGSHFGADRFNFDSIRQFARSDDLPDEGLSVNFGGVTVAQRLFDWESKLLQQKEALREEERKLHRLLDAAIDRQTKLSAKAEALDAAEKKLIEDRHELEARVRTCSAVEEDLNEKLAAFSAEASSARILASTLVSSVREYTKSTSPTEATGEGGASGDQPQDIAEMQEKEENFRKREVELRQKEENVQKLMQALEDREKALEAREADVLASRKGVQRDTMIVTRRESACDKREADATALEGELKTKYEQYTAMCEDVVRNLEDLSQRESACAARENAMLAKEKEMERCEQNLQSREKELCRREDVLRDTEKSTRDREAACAQREESIEGSVATMQLRQSALADREAACVQRENDLQVQVEAFDGRQKALEREKHRLEQLVKELLVQEHDLQTARESLHQQQGDLAEKSDSLETLRKDLEMRSDALKQLECSQSEREKVLQQRETSLTARERRLLSSQSSSNLPATPPRRTTQRQPSSIKASPTLAPPATSNSRRDVSTQATERVSIRGRHQQPPSPSRPGASPGQAHSALRSGGRPEAPEGTSAAELLRVLNRQHELMQQVMRTREDLSSLSQRHPKVTPDSQPVTATHTQSPVEKQVRTPGLSSTSPRQVDSHSQHSPEMPGVGSIAATDVVASDKATVKGSSSPTTKTDSPRLVTSNAAAVHVVTDGGAPGWLQSLLSHLDCVADVVERRAADLMEREAGATAWKKEALGELDSLRSEALRARVAAEADLDRMQELYSTLETQRKELQDKEDLVRDRASALAAAEKALESRLLEAEQKNEELSRGSGALKAGLDALAREKESFDLQRREILALKESLQQRAASIEKDQHKLNAERAEFLEESQQYELKRRVACTELENKTAAVEAKARALRENEASLSKRESDFVHKNRKVAQLECTMETKEHESSAREAETKRLEALARQTLLQLDEREKDLSKRMQELRLRENELCRKSEEDSEVGERARLLEGELQRRGEELAKKASEHRKAHAELEAQRVAHRREVAILEEEQRALASEKDVLRERENALLAREKEAARALRAVAAREKGVSAADSETKELSADLARREQAIDAREARVAEDQKKLKESQESLEKLRTSLLEREGHLESDVRAHQRDASTLHHRIEKLSSDEKAVAASAAQLDVERENLKSQTQAVEMKRREVERLREAQNRLRSHLRTAFAEILELACPNDTIDVVSHALRESIIDKDSDSTARTLGKHVTLLESRDIYGTCANAEAQLAASHSSPDLAFSLLVGPPAATSVLSDPTVAVPQPDPQPGATRADTRAEESAPGCYKDCNPPAAVPGSGDTASSKKSGQEPSSSALDVLEYALRKLKDKARAIRSQTEALILREKDILRKETDLREATLALAHERGSWEEEETRRRDKLVSTEEEVHAMQKEICQRLSDMEASASAREQESARLRDTEAEWGRRSADVEKRQQALQGFEASLRQRDEQISKDRARLQQEEERLARLSKALGAKEADAEAREKMIRQREVDLDEREAVVTQKEKVRLPQHVLDSIAQREAALHAREAEAAREREARQAELSRERETREAGVAWLTERESAVAANEERVREREREVGREEARVCEREKALCLAKEKFEERERRLEEHEKRVCAAERQAEEVESEYQDRIHALGISEAKVEAREKIAEASEAELCTRAVEVRAREKAVSVAETEKARALEKLNMRENALKKTEEALAAEEESIRRREETLERTEAEVAESLAQIKAQQRELEKSQSALQHLQEQLKKRELLAEEAEKSIQLRETELVTLEKELSTKAAELQARADALQAQESEHDAAVRCLCKDKEALLHDKQAIETDQLRLAEKEQALQEREKSVRDAEKAAEVLRVGVANHEDQLNASLQQVLARESEASSAMAKAKALETEMLERNAQWDATVEERRRKEALRLADEEAALRERSRELDLREESLKRREEEARAKLESQKKDMEESLKSLEAREHACAANVADVARQQARVRAASERAALSEKTKQREITRLKDEVLKAEKMRQDTWLTEARKQLRAALDSLAMREATLEERENDLSVRELEVVKRLNLIQKDKVLRSHEQLLVANSAAHPVAHRTDSPSLYTTDKIEQGGMMAQYSAKATPMLAVRHIDYLDTMGSVLGSSGSPFTSLANRPTERRSASHRPSKRGHSRATSPRFRVDDGSRLSNNAHGGSRVPRFRDRDPHGQTPTSCLTTNRISPSGTHGAAEIRGSPSMLKRTQSLPSTLSTDTVTNSNVCTPGLSGDNWWDTDDWLGPEPPVSQMLSTCVEVGSPSPASGGPTPGPMPLQRSVSGGSTQPSSRQGTATDGAAPPPLLSTASSSSAASMSPRGD